MFVWLVLYFTVFYRMLGLGHCSDSDFTCTRTIIAVDHRTFIYPLNFRPLIYKLLYSHPLI